MALVSRVDIAGFVGPIRLPSLHSVRVWKVERINWKNWQLGYGARQKPGLGGVQKLG